MASDFLKTVVAEIDSYKTIAQSLDTKNLSKIVNVVNVVEQTITRGGSIFFCGNGGSCSQSEHLAAEFIGRYSAVRKPIKALSLSSGTSVISCIANDFGFSRVYSRQLEAFGSSKDCIIMLSTSGQSPNIVEASKVARRLGVKSILLTGNNVIHEDMDVDIIIQVDSSDTARIQEVHLLVGHIICKCIDSTLAN